MLSMLPMLPMLVCKITKYSRVGCFNEFGSFDLGDDDPFYETARNKNFAFDHYFHCEIKKLTQLQCHLFFESYYAIQYILFSRQRDTTIKKYFQTPRCTRIIYLDPVDPDEQRQSGN